MARWVKSKDSMRIFKTTTTPTVAAGATIGDLWIDTNSGAILKTCTVVSPVTFSIAAINAGTTTNDNATAGDKGEVSSSANATAVAMTSGAVTQIQTLTLGAGDWDVWATFYTTVGGTTTSSGISCQLHTSTATIAVPSTIQLASIQSMSGNAITGGVTYLGTPQSRWSLSGNTVVYLNAVATYAVSTLTGNGMIHARRVR